MILLRCSRAILYMIYHETLLRHNHCRKSPVQHTRCALWNYIEHRRAVLCFQRMCSHVNSSAHPPHHLRALRNQANLSEEGARAPSPYKKLFSWVSPFNNDFVVRILSSPCFSASAESFQNNGITLLLVLYIPIRDTRVSFAPVGRRLVVKLEYKPCDAALRDKLSAA